jgi:hypothetical protein
MAGPPPKKPAAKMPAKKPAGKPAAKPGAKAPAKGGSGDFPKGAAAALNPVFGLGSYIQGDVLGGVICSVGAATAVSLVLVEKFARDWDSGIGESSGLVGFAGICAGGATVIFGVLRPILWKGGSGRHAQVLDGINIGAVSDIDGNRGVSLSYSFQF